MAVEVDFVFTLIYIGLFWVYLYPPTEFAQAGLTLTNLCDYILDNPNHFIHYHLQRTTLNVVVVTLMPVVYMLSLQFWGEADGLRLFWTGDNYLIGKIIYSILLVTSTRTLYKIYSYGVDFSKNPIVLRLEKFSNNRRDWKLLADDISREILSIDKIQFKPNLVTNVIVTDNWIIKTTNFTVNIAHRSDSVLTVKSTDSHALSHIDPAGVQFLTIEVKSSRVPPFDIRLNASDFQALRDRLSGVIFVPENIKINKSVVEKFVDVFKEAIANNETYLYEQELEQCIGCMQNKSEVKLRKLCQETTCTNCYCKPLWCADCMAMWFANRQDIEQVNTWLSSKCTCPMCRSTFCILDVCFVLTNETS